MEILDEIVSEFVVESYESLDQLDRDLMALEESPEDVDRLSSIFRAIHTIKGTSGFLGFSKLEKVTHVGESLLVPLRDGELTLTNDITNNLLAMVDAVRSMLGNIEGGHGEGEDSYQPLMETLTQLKTGEPTEGAPEATEFPVEDVVDEVGSSNDLADTSVVDSRAEVAPKKKTSRKRSIRAKKTTTKSKKAAAKEGDESPLSTAPVVESAETVDNEVKTVVEAVVPKPDAPACAGHD